MLIALAVFASLVSLASGLAAVGDGTRFNYESNDILQGRKDAILYVWVACSTVFALAHCAALLDYGLASGWVVQSASSVKWLWLHTALASLLTAAHVFVRHELADPVKRLAYLWGPKKYHVPG